MSDRMKVITFGCTECGAVMKLLPGETDARLKYGCTECDNVGWADREMVE